MGVVTKSHPCGFIIKLLFHIKQIYTLLASSLKITSGEILAKEVAGESGGKAKEHHRQDAIKGSQHIKSLELFQKYSLKSRIRKRVSFNPSINAPIKP